MSLSFPATDADNHILPYSSWQSLCLERKLFLSDLTVSVFITGLAVGLDPEGYGNPDFCWISIYDKLLWSFAGPIAIVILVIAVERTKHASLPLKNPNTFFQMNHTELFIQPLFHSCFSVQMNGGIFMIVAKISCSPSQKETKKLPVM